MSDNDNLNINLSVSHRNQFPPHDNKNIFMNILSLNIQSLRNKLSDFTIYIENSKLRFHVIVLTETHIRDNETKLFNLPGYEVEHCVRKSGRFGGVSIFVRKDFSTFSLIHKLDFEMNNSLLINILKYDIRIAAFYRCRDSNCDNFLNRLDYVLDNYNNCYVFGDFNLDLFTRNTDPKVKKYYDLVQTNGYLFLNSLSVPTRIDVTRNTATCIDHILTDAIFHTSNLAFTVSVDDLFGDHKALLLSVTKDKRLVQKPSHFEFKKVDHARIISQNLISNASLNSFDSFQIDLKSIFQKNTQVLRKKEKFKKPFMNVQILSYITIRHNYFRLKKKYPNSMKVLNRFIFYRNLVSKKIKAAKIEYYDKQFSYCQDDPKETWRNINNLLRNSDSKKESSCSTIKSNNTVMINRHQIVETFNAFFVTVVDKIHSSLSIDSTVFNSLHDFETYNITVPFYCAQTSPEEVLYILSNLSNSKAEDPNCFSNFLFKKYKISLSSPISRLINNCLDKSTFPKCLKVAKVIPLFKSGDKTDINNYRPVAISPIDSKCFESVLLNRIEEHLSNNEILCKFQFGYTKNSNCESAVLHVMNQIYVNKEKKLTTCALFIDLSKAFDSLYHPLLKSKLRKLKFTNKFQLLLDSYLTERFQYVEIEGTKSPQLHIGKGVFQGSKLAAIFFLIYINSIFNLPLNGKLFLYADDIALIYGVSDCSQLKLKMEYDLKVLDIWFTNHYLKMNILKTNYILFEGKAKLDYFTQNALNIQLNNQVINRVDIFKYLGFWIDEGLSFTQHIKHVKSKILPMTFAIKRIRPYISQKTALKLYFAHINSHLLYMNPFWSAANETILNSLAVAQRKCLRFVFNRYSYSPSSELFSLQVLPLKQLNTYNMLILAFKISHNLLTNNVELRLVSDLHDHQTRQRNNFYVENYQTRFGFANFFTRGLLIYNSLDIRLKNIHSISRFKREIKYYLLNEYLSGGN